MENIDVAIIALGLASVCCLPPKPAWCQSGRDMPSAAYVQALRTADEFMTLWIHNDGERAWPMLSARLQKEIGSRSRLVENMAEMSNPKHQAFTVGRAPTAPANRYIFPVITYELALSDPVGNSETGEIVVLREGAGWKIDRIPKALQHP